MRIRILVAVLSIAPLAFAVGSAQADVTSDFGAIHAGTSGAQWSGTGTAWVQDVLKGMNDQGSNAPVVIDNPASQFELSSAVSPVSAASDMSQGNSGGGSHDVNGHGTTPTVPAPGAALLGAIGLALSRWVKRSA